MSRLFPCFYSFESFFLFIIVWRIFISTLRTEMVLEEAITLAKMVILPNMIIPS